MHDRTFPDRLRECIVDEPVASFARRCRLSEGLIRAYLKGEKQPGMERLVAIAEVAGVTLDWLATGRGQKHRREAQPRATIEDSASPYARRWEKIITLVEGIEDADQRAKALDELFARAQSAAELAELRQAVLQLQKTAKKPT